jgi:hypothetical protein
LVHLIVIPFFIAIVFIGFLLARVDFNVKSNFGIGSNLTVDP